jgi:hypothetical protein
MTLSRRTFLDRVARGGAGAALGFWLASAERRAEGAEPPSRLMIIHRPNGAPTGAWLDGLTPGPILSAFDGLPTCVLANLRLVADGADAGHGAGMVTWSTGTPLGETRPPFPDDWKNTSRSLDLIFAESSPFLSGVPLASLNVAAHDRIEGGTGELSDSTLTYTGPDEPIPPDVRASRVYARIFSGLLPGGDTPEARAALARVRMQKHSVLDLVRDDLATLERLAPAHERPKLERHAEAIRDLERRLDTDLSMQCAPVEIPSGELASSDFLEVERNAERLFAIVRAAFSCDLTRQITFMWSIGQSPVQFEALFPGMERISHHTFSHADPTSAFVQQRLTAVERWYAERTAAFVRSLRETPSDGGTLLDETLILYVNEIAEGSSHLFSPMPTALFGGAATCLVNGVVDAGGRSTNDLWLALAERFAVPMTTLGSADQWSGPLPGVFDASG